MLAANCLRLHDLTGAAHTRPPAWPSQAANLKLQEREEKLRGQWNTPNIPIRRMI